MSHLEKGNIRPLDLKTGDTINSFGLDNRNPVLSWRLESEHRAQRQTAYRIIVSSEGFLKESVGDMWDSKKVMSHETIQIVYSGAPLLSKKRYYWKVMVWDANDRASEWSDEVWFEMGLLEPEDWEGVWIGGNSQTNPLEQANWIWQKNSSDDEAEKTCCFRRVFSIPEDKTVQQVIFDGTAESSCELYINGCQVRHTNTEWKQDYTSPMRYVDVTDKILPGMNCLSCVVTKDFSGKGGFIGRLHIRFKEAVIRTTSPGHDDDEFINTDETWEVNSETVQNPAKIEASKIEWEKAVVIGTYGDQPWGRPKRRGPAPLLRKEFVVMQDIIQARLYICGLGYYDLHINGIHINNAVLATEYSQYDRTVYYNTIDVTEAVNKGGNCIGAELGRGYYSFHKDWIGLMPEQDEPKLLLQLNLIMADGSTMSITSNRTWQTTDGPTLDDSIWYGEKYDSRLEKQGWNISGYDSGEWLGVKILNPPAGKMKASLMPPIKIVEVLKPVAIMNPGINIRIYDFGKITTGWAKIHLNEDCGTRIKLTYGEKLLEDGRVDVISKDAVYQFWEPPQVDIYICRGGRHEEWEPKFSYKGFRYIEVEGVDDTIDIKGNVLHNTLESTGTFSCSNELFNSIHALVTPTMLNNFHSIPTDTPIYEKRGWTGDAQVICETAILNLDSHMFLKKWVGDLADCQSGLGEIPDTCPGPVHYPPAPEWMCAFIVIPYNLYLYYGDLEILKIYYSKMKSYGEYEINRMDNCLSSNKYYGDWNSPGSSRPPEGAVLSSTLYVYHICSLMAKISEVLKMDKDSEFFSTVAEKIKQTVNEKFFDINEKLYRTEVEAGFRQTSTVLPLAFGMVPKELQQGVVSQLAENIKTKDNSHLNTGCFGLKYLTPVLTENGEAELAFTIVNQTSYPSWGYWLANGATTCWETWDTNSRSYNHFYFGTIDNWFYQYLGGIRPETAGYRDIVIRPYICGDLKYAKVCLKTVRGRITSEWTIKDGKFYLNIEVPVNTTSDVYIPVNSPAEITEGGIPAAESQGVTFKQVIGKTSVFSVESGIYSFKAPWAGA